MALLNKDDINKSWDRWLTNFKEDVFPTFAKHGISFESALLLYRTNLIQSAIEDLGEVEDDDEEDDIDKIIRENKI